MELINASAEAYAAKFATPQSALLQQIENETLSGHAHANMLSGHVQGNLLSLFSKMIKPRRVLEIGTFTGFSALCLAQGLTSDGVLHTIEIREEDAKTSMANFTKAKATGYIKLHVGDARQILKELNEPWDIVFIDADKVSYIEYYELTLPFLKQGGYIIADNVLFHGQVLDQPIQGKNAIAIHEFNNHVMADNRTEQVMLTVRDGIMLIRKL